MKNLLILIITILFFASCSKDSAETQPDQLPPITTTGANTAGCLIDGKVLIPKNGSQAIGGSLLYGLKYYVGNNFGNPGFDDYFAINIKNRKDIDGDEIYIHLNKMIIGTGVYAIGQSNGNYYIASPPNNHAVLKKGVNSGNIKSYISSSTSGLVTVTRFDYPNKIISGFFSFTLYNVNNPI